MQAQRRPEAPGRVLVTGASGFIGGWLVRRLAGAGHPIRVLLRPGRHPPPSDPPVEVHRGDLAEPAGLEGVADGVDYVLHCASLLGKWGTPEEVIRRVNVEGSLNLLRQFRDRPVRRFVHLSAGGVTGPLEARQVDESYPPRPATAYERTKLEAERRALSEGARWGIPVVVVRPTFTYGPGDPHKLALFRAIRKGRYIHIDGGASVNHPAFIDDVVEGIGLAMLRGRPGEVYIVGGERPVSKRELVETIADALGVGRPRLSLPRPLAWQAGRVLELLGRWVGVEPILTRSRVMMMADNFGYSIDKARRELGYEPKVALQEGIRRTVAAYRAEGLL